jgi:hypothetical protein
MLFNGSYARDANAVAFPSFFPNALASDRLTETPLPSIARSRYFPAYNFKSSHELAALTTLCIEFLMNAGSRFFLALDTF